MKLEFIKNDYLAWQITQLTLIPEFLNKYGCNLDNAMDWLALSAKLESSTILPEEYSGKEVLDVKLITSATRIVLMAILMMLISDIKDQDFIIDEHYLPIGTGEKSAVEYLRSCALKACYS